MLALTLFHHVQSRHCVTCQFSNSAQSVADKGNDNFTSGTKRKPDSLEMDKTATAQFYIDIFDDELVKSDAIKAAAAQSIACICCASDRNEAAKKEPIGLLVSLEFMLDRILGKLCASCRVLAYLSPCISS